MTNGAQPGSGTADNGSNHAEFLELVAQGELAVWADRLCNRRIKAAALRDLQTPEDFDWQSSQLRQTAYVRKRGTCWGSFDAAWRLRMGTRRTYSATECAGGMWCVNGGGRPWRLGVSAYGWHSA